MKSKFLLAWILAFSIAMPKGAFADGESCLMPIFRSMAPRLYRASENFRTIDPALIRGEVIPKWTDFEKLKQILEDARVGKKLLLDSGKFADLDQVFSEIARSYAEDAQTAFLKNIRKDAKLTTSYQPTEYALKREYQSLLWQLNKELPKEMKIPGVRLPVDLRLPNLLADGKKMVKAQEEFFESHIADYGYKDMNEFNEALSKQSDTSRKLMKMFESEEVEMAMNRPENARWWVPRVGFQNQRVTGSSRGALDNNFRNVSEARMMHWDLEPYEKLDNQLKPNFGYLRSKLESGMIQSRDADPYGSDTFIFKKEKVRDRLTWTSGNSLGTPYYFIPWKDRNLAIPDLLQEAGDDNLGFRAVAPAIPMPKFEKPVMPKLVLEEMMGPAPLQPKLVFPAEPVPPTGAPTVVYPNPPPFPATVSTYPVAPQMPPLENGETFADALKKYQESPVYLDYQKQLTDIQNTVQKINQDYNNSQAMIDFKKQVADLQAQYQKERAVYTSTKEYTDYLAQVEKYNASTIKIRDDFEKTPEMIAYRKAVTQYNLDYTALNARNQAKVDAFHLTPEWKDYSQKMVDYQAKISAAQDTDQYKWLHYNSYTNPYIAFNGTPLEKFHKIPSNGYIELQYWGPTTLDDVEIFEFRENPPSGEFLQQLLQHGIKIRDGRVRPAVEWKPTP